MAPQRPSKKVRPAERISEAAVTGATNLKSESIIGGPADLLADLDALAESLRGYFVVQVVIDDEGHRRTFLYRSAAPAERCVQRAKERGRYAHVTLCSLLPAGVVVGLGGGR